MLRLNKKEKMVFESLSKGETKTIRVIVFEIRQATNDDSVSFQEIHNIIKASHLKKFFVSNGLVPAGYNLTTEGINYYKQNL